MTDPRSPRDEAVSPVATLYLHPGLVFASAEPHAVTTILGSCVAACLFDAGARIGGINHYLLPRGAGRSSPRFGDAAMTELVARVLALGARHDRLEAKIFGGACVIDAFEKRVAHLGEQNVQCAVSFLDRAGVPIVSRATGGRRGRKLVFSTGDGTAWVKEI